MCREKALFAHLLPATLGVPSTVRCGGRKDGSRHAWLVTGTQWEVDPIQGSVHRIGDQKNRTARYSENQKDEVVLAPKEPHDDDQLKALMDKVRLQFMLGEEDESSEDELERGGVDERRRGRVARLGAEPRCHRDQLRIDLSRGPGQPRQGCDGYDRGSFTAGGRGPQWRSTVSPASCSALALRRPDPGLAEHAHVQMRPGSIISASARAAGRTSTSCIPSWRASAWTSCAHQRIDRGLGLLLAVLPETPKAFAWRSTTSPTRPADAEATGAEPGEPTLRSAFVRDPRTTYAWPVPPFGSPTITSPRPSPSTSPAPSTVKPSWQPASPLIRNPPAPSCRPGSTFACPRLP
jgi:hypothetical protein